MIGEIDYNPKKTRRNDIMKVGIVGHGNGKFTFASTVKALKEIVSILQRDRPDVVISGGSPLGGIDEWAEMVAFEMGIETQIFRPEINSWDPDGYGFKARNIDIAKNSDKLYVIVVDDYPPKYKWKKLLKSGKPYCYHCNDGTHVKSGGCWTGWYAINECEDKEVEWIIISQEGV